MMKMCKCLFLFFVLQVFGCGLAYGRYSLNNQNQSSVSKKYLEDPRSSGCECGGYTCGCCVYMDLPKIHLNDTGCMNMSYLPKEYGIKLTVTIDKWDLVNVTISAKNPPPICFGEEFFEEHADLCLRFYDLNATYTSLHACAQIMARLHKLIIARYELGCFDLGNGKIHLHIEELLSHMKENYLYVPHVFVNYLQSLKAGTGNFNEIRKYWQFVTLAERKKLEKTFHF